jgi:hypothetical protein
MITFASLQTVTFSMNQKFGVMLMLGLTHRLQQLRRSLTDNEAPQGAAALLRGPRSP